MEKTVISLYFGNAQYRQGAQERKRQPRYFLENGFRFLEVTLPRQGYGNSGEWMMKASRKVAGMSPNCGDPRELVDMTGISQEPNMLRRLWLEGDELVWAGYW